ncbi:hypothetical protein [Oryza sativa Japonica Group]|uniref:Uncharacterized protein n=1 Tax=Oryza sativa subsp. japonica TaxID=39947 RepID=Q656X8_ORYSJ|nr:hypothetical protein [Oryza sativa Japonica Group]
MSTRLAPINGGPGESSCHKAKLDGPDKMAAAQRRVEGGYRVDGGVDGVGVGSWVNCGVDGVCVLVEGISVGWVDGGVGGG